MPLPRQREFLKKYKISRPTLEKASVAWAVLEDIVADFVSRSGELQAAAAYIVERLRTVAEVHSLKFRIKDPEHLAEKIIRKMAADRELKIETENYRDRITDLVGVRALHLFKEDWPTVHEFIVNTWELNETPTVNVRKGDPEELTRMFRDHGCNINEHEFGYRSVHYIVKSQPGRDVVLAEVQVRTIFEEGWSEIDHKIRYPYDRDNAVLSQFLVIFNRLAGSADEMGSFIRFLRQQLQSRDDEHAIAKAEHGRIVAELKDRIEKLEIGQNQKDALDKQLESLQKARPETVLLPPGIGKVSAFSSLRALSGPIIPNFSFVYDAASDKIVSAPKRRAQSTKPNRKSSRRTVSHAKVSKRRRGAKKKRE